MDVHAASWSDVSNMALWAGEFYRGNGDGRVLPSRDPQRLVYAQFVLREAHRRIRGGPEPAATETANAALRRGLLAAVNEPWSRHDDPQAAREQLSDALTAYGVLRHRPGEAAAHLALAYVSQLLGDDASERAHAEDALRLYVEGGDEDGEAEARFALGGIALRNRDDSRAREHLTRAVELFTRARENVTRATGLSDPDQAWGTPHPGWAWALARLWLAVLGPSHPGAGGRLLRLLGRGDGTIELESALTAFHEREPAPLMEAAILTDAALQARAQGRHVIALQVALAATRRYDDVRRRIASAEGRARFRREQRSAHLLALDLAAITQNGAAALEVSEADRHSVVADIVQHGMPGTLRRHGLPREFLRDPSQRLYETLRAVVRVEAEYAATDTKSPALEHRLDEAYGDLREEIWVLGRALLGWIVPNREASRVVHERLETDLWRGATPEFRRLIERIARIWEEEGRLEAVRGSLAREIAGLTMHEQATADPMELLRSLPHTHVLLAEVSRLDDHCHLFTVWTAPGRPPEVARVELDEEALAWMEGFAAGGRGARLFEPDSRRFGRLGELLLPERLRRLLLAGGREQDPLRLLLSPAGGLWKLPFAALRVEAGRAAPLLAERACLTYVPSLGVRAALTGRDPSAEAAGALGYFNPTLHAADVQRSALAAHFGRFEEVTDANGLVAALDRADERAVCVLGAHGDERLGIAHALDLGAGAVLHAGDLLVASLPEVVVLGACSSGSLALEPGEEPLGLPTAALAGGARTVLAALFPVPDQETAEILAGAYAAIARGAEPAAALREAQLAHIAGCAGRELCPPMHWAGCVAIGRG